MKPIVATNIVKSFANVKNGTVSKMLHGDVERIVVLNGISFAVKKGELLGVMGRNGAGKSTLLRLLGGVYSQDSGIISINGEIASIFEMGSFLNIHQTGREYCRDYLNFFANDTCDVPALVDSIHRFTELDDFFDKPILTYSSGMKAKLLFAVATALPSDIFLIDEMLVVGDEYFQGKAWKRLCEMLSQGTSGVIVSHDWVSLLRLCERTMIIEDGKVSFIGESTQAVRKYLDTNPIVSDEVVICDKEKLTETQFVYTNGQSVRFPVHVQVNRPPQDGILEILIIIERYIKGIGWSCACTCTETVQDVKAGELEVEFYLPCLELAPGSYHIAISDIIPPGKGEMVARKIYEEMSWLRGNSIRLQIVGENEKNALIKKRLDWTICYT